MFGTKHSFIGLLLGSANSSIGNVVLTLCRARNQGWQEPRARIFITGCQNWYFKNLGSPKSVIEKVKITAMIMYINK